MYTWMIEDSPVVDYRIECPVEDGMLPVEDDINAFRILLETDQTYFLDFICYSPVLQRGRVVARLRVGERALRAFRDRLTSGMLEAPSKGIIFAWPENSAVN